MKRNSHSKPKVKEQTRHLYDLDLKRITAGTNGNGDAGDGDVIPGGN